MSSQDAMTHVTFSTFVTSLASSALVHLGAMPEPGTTTARVDLPVARDTIEALAMLEQKTAGNLDEGESKHLASLLADLRARYVEVSRAQRGA